MITPEQLRSAVNDALGVALVQRVLHEFTLDDESLHALAPEGIFFEHAILLTIYRDLKNISYDNLYKDISTWHRIAESTFKENSKKIRRGLRLWAARILVPEDKSTLDKAARRRKRPFPCNNVNLWIDTSDFAEEGERGLSRFDSRFSHKTMGAARKWLTICDGKGRAQFVGGPHYPKHYDSDLLIHYAQRLHVIFADSTMIGDNHFLKAKDFLKRVRLIAPTSEAGRPAKDPITGEKRKHELTEEEKLNNELIRSVRATVEHPYNWLSNKFQSLYEVFREDEDQHDCLVRFALACHRLSIN